MEGEKFTLSSLRQDIIDNNLHVKAIIQDILSYRGSSISDLESLNDAGRLKLSALRKCIEKLDDWARDEGDPELSKEVDSHREQFSQTLQAFRKANISTMLEIEKLNRDELFTTNNSDIKNDNKNDGTTNANERNVTSSMNGDGINNSNINSSSSSSSSSSTGNTTNLRQRTTNKSSLLSQHENVTERMLSISRHLSETTQKSAATLETLIASSQNVGDTRDELLNTGGTISQSGKLLQKYGRRECTDKILIFLAFAFFLACVFYIVQKRLF